MDKRGFLVWAAEELEGEVVTRPELFCAAASIGGVQLMPPGLVLLNCCLGVDLRLSWTARADLGIAELPEAGLRLDRWGLTEAVSAVLRCLLEHASLCPNAADELDGGGADALGDRDIKKPRGLSTDSLARFVELPVCRGVLILSCTMPGLLRVASAARFIELQEHRSAAPRGLSSASRDKFDELAVCRVLMPSCARPEVPRVASAARFIELQEHGSAAPRGVVFASCVIC